MARSPQLEKLIDDLASSLQEATRQTEAALERDRTKVAEVVTAIKQELHSYSWLIEGRGSYEWDDDRWHDEFKRAHEAISEALKPLERIAGDWTNCPKTDAEVKAARQAIRAKDERIAELVAKWRNEAIYYKGNMRFAVDRCADDLERVLSNTSPPLQGATEAARQARLEENDRTPHYTGCATLLAVRDPYPPCNCWVGARRAELERK
jgi:hypothetical protein